MKLINSQFDGHIAYRNVETPSWTLLSMTTLLGLLCFARHYLKFTCNHYSMSRRKWGLTSLKTDTAPLLPAATTIGDVWQNSKQDKFLFSS